MKNFILLFGFIILFFQNSYSQDLCTGSFTPYELNANHINASFYPRGNKFTDIGTKGFLVPYPSSENFSTINASSIWIAGFDDAGNLKIGVETYPSSVTKDFGVGPLTSIGVPYYDLCEKYDHVWSVYRDDIEKHKIDYSDNLKIDDTIPSIFGWPGRGNKYFKNYYGFELPFDSQGLAPFADNNGNSIYEPEKGEYPDVLHSGFEYRPDQILWMVFNDADDGMTGHAPLRFEIQLTAFAFHCQDNEILNNTVFNKYKIINRAVAVADSIFFGTWTDYDLGCSEDDFIGSDSSRSTEFVYNADIQDGDIGSDCSTGGATFNEVPPIQSLTYLNPPMYSMINSPRSYLTPLEYYRLLNGEWEDGTPMRPDSNGYYTSADLATTKFLFNGDPRDSLTWSANNVFDKGTDVKIVSSVSLGRMNPGAVKEVEMAYMYHHVPGGSQNDQITKMYHDVDSLFSFIDQTTSFCTPYQFCLDGDCVWPGDFNDDGIADQFDLLYWGVMNGAQGGKRDGLVSWRGHYAPAWNTSLPQGTDYKHGDGNGDGVIDIHDLKQNIAHFSSSNPSFHRLSYYPVGPEVKITALPISTSGKIRHLEISAGTSIENLSGLAYEIEFDTSLFQIGNGLNLEFSPGNTIRIYGPDYQVPIDYPQRANRYAFVSVDHTTRTIDQSYTFQSILGGLQLKPGIALSGIPDSTIIRLRNLIGIDADGNDLHIGSQQLVVYKQDLTATKDLLIDDISIYPNPASDRIYVNVPFDLDGEIMSVEGKFMKKVLLTESKAVEIGDLLPGVYYLKITGYARAKKIIVF